ncbi:META domain-containing protein [Tessaracoccus sp. HDW20]|uniref:META domain-containing protein n=1 Tax=Tessaracoccus coleopterorum TaxID=2714950 RepID=UPI0018D2F371|nr:META domain-containing protein [Tessaracoccus coleopterorum]
MQTRRSRSPEDGTISGSGGCNRLFGSCTAADGIISLGDSLEMRTPDGATALRFVRA